MACHNISVKPIKTDLAKNIQSALPQNSNSFVLIMPEEPISLFSSTEEPYTSTVALSCKMNKVNIFDYLTDVIKKITDWQPNTPLEKYRELLPEKWVKECEK